MASSGTFALKGGTVLVTGAAGFIGYHLARRLASDGVAVVGLDNLNDYYDVSLKQARLEDLSRYSNFTFVRASLEDQESINALFARFRPSSVVNLAAQAGVRYSLSSPQTYIQSNIVGFLNILEACRHHKVQHLIYASSSSVYGANRKLPFSVGDAVDHPISLYAVSKKSNELMAHSYSHLFNIPATGLRFFTVYGPWGRPDMAMFIFTRAIMEGKPLPVFNHGRMQRDFTYVDDVIEAMVRLIPKPAEPDPTWSAETPNPATSSAPHRIYNIGNNRPVELLHLIRLLEQGLGRNARLDMLPMQPGDVTATYADIDALQAAVGFAPSTPLEIGVERFLAWFKEFYGVA